MVRDGDTGATLPFWLVPPFWLALEDVPPGTVAVVPYPDTRNFATSRGVGG